MIRTGTARFWDMYWHPEATSRAVRDAGLRATVGGPLFGLGEDTAEIEATTLANLDAQEKFEPAGIDRALAPHSIYIAGEKLLRSTSDLAAERGRRSTSTSPRRSRRFEGCLAAPRRAPRPLPRQPQAARRGTVLTHGIWLDRYELELIAERRSTVVTDPGSPT